MIVCLDTNVLVQARAISHPHGVLLDGFIFGLMDKHFAPLANAGYKPQPIRPDEFIKRFRGVCC